ncbi:MAG TPA: hypothetical protein VFE41_07925, partial [Acetobacteraceae bacterium]|nr:hypothetical protein [Acetobacteraceae bacterium]
DQEHLRQITQAQFVSEAPEDHQRDDVGRVLSAVENSTAALIELLSTNTAPEASVTARRPQTSAASHSMHRISRSPTQADHTPAGLYQASRSWRDG